MKKKVAVFKYIDVSFHLTGIFEESAEKQPNIVRISEYVEIEFPEMSAADIAAREIAQLDKQIAVASEAAQKVETLTAKKAELLAITHSPEAA